MSIRNGFDYITSHRAMLFGLFEKGGKATCFAVLIGLLVLSGCCKMRRALLCGEGRGSTEDRRSRGGGRGDRGQERGG